MKKSIIILAMLASSPALAMPAAEFFARDKERNWDRPLAYQSDGTPRSERATRSREPRQHIRERQRRVVKVVERQARQKLGERWVKTAVKISYVESRHNPAAVGPKTRHGRARGVMQVIPPTARAMGFQYSRLNELEYGVAAGIHHMAICIQTGVRTDAEMAACHVAGPKGWQIRLRRTAQTYKYRYVAMVQRAPGRWD